MVTSADAYRQYYSSRSGYKYPTTTLTPTVLRNLNYDTSKVNLADRVEGVYLADYAKKLLDNPVSFGGGGGGSGSNTGIFRGFRMPNTETDPTPDTPLNWNDILARSQAPYDTLSAQLRELVEKERGNIAQATSQAVNSLGSVDPLAGYRETYRAAEVAPAAAMSYLNAIGANPAQVEAQRNLANQLIGAGMTSQQGFSSAVDQANQNYRLAQLAEAYLNQQRADAGLGAMSTAQQGAISMAATQQRNDIAKMLLEVQLQLLQQAASGNLDKIKPDDVQPSLSWASQFLGLGA